MEKICHPLHFAIQYQDPTLISLLAEAGADMSKADKDGRTPMQLLLELQGTSNETKGLLLDTLLKCGLSLIEEADAVWDRSNKQQIAPLKLLLKMGLDPHYTNGDNKPLLQKAINKKNLLLIRLLLSYGATPEAEEEWPIDGDNFLDPVTYIQCRSEDPPYSEESPCKFFKEMETMLAAPQEWLQEQNKPNDILAKWKAEFPRTDKP
jgi:hypothetical protein